MMERVHSRKNRLGKFLDVTLNYGSPPFRMDPSSIPCSLRHQVGKVDLTLTGGNLALYFFFFLVGISTLKGVGPLLVPLLRGGGDDDGDHGFTATLLKPRTNFKCRSEFLGHGSFRR